MTIAAGTRFGRYEVRSQIGEGGMGEVYLALDIQLDREIALKILTAEVARDQQRLHRFLQEARAASALSHPNVAHIYEIGEVEGAHFIAMEFVEGQSLDQMIGGRSLGVSEILDIGIQIADALDEAHAKGITHRDIKSSNIMITSRGRAKVLDFGLAKLALPGSAEQPGSGSELATRVKTRPGIVVGTVNYMSPEQAMGRVVDHRTDIFSFGVVLYEMATGRLPFAGNSITETIDRIAHAQPEAIARLNYNIPNELEVIVKKALRKDRDERYQTIRDLLGDLRELKRDVDVATSLEPSTPPASSTNIGISFPPASAQTGFVQTMAPRVSTSEVAAAHPTSSAEYIVGEIRQHKAIAIAIICLIVFFVAVIAIGGFGVYKYYTFRPTPVSTRTLASANMKITRVTSTGKATHASISPDGNYVVHVNSDAGRQSLWVRQTATGSNVQIVAPTEVVYWGITFSRDGNYVYYVGREKGTGIGFLWRVPVLGGTPVMLIKDVDSAITISPDSQQIAFIRWNPPEHNSGLWLANVDGTSEHKLATRQEPEMFSGSPAWSPDGKVIACPMKGLESGIAYAIVLAINVASGEQNPITSKRWNQVGRLAWLGESELLLNASEQNSTLSAQLWYLSSTNGQAQPITHDLNNYTDVTLTADSSTLVTVQSDMQSNVWLVPDGDAAHARQLTAGKSRDGMRACWTADGKIVYDSVVSGNPDIWVMDPDGRNQKQLTSDPHADYSPFASPDGRYIVFGSDRSGTSHLWRINADGSNPKQITSGNTAEFEPVITPDSRWVVYNLLSHGAPVWRIPIDGGNPEQISNQEVWRSAVSPDGQLIAFWAYSNYRSGGDGRVYLGLMSFNGGSPGKTFVVPQAAAGVNLQWRSDGQALFYVDTQNGVSNIWSQPLDGGSPKKVTNFQADTIFSFAFSRDGKQLEVTRGNVTSDVVLIRNFR